MVEIAFDLETGETYIKYNTIQKHLKDDVEEALRNYGLDVLNIEAIKNETQN